MRQGRLMTSLCFGFAVLAALALLTMADAQAADDDHPVVVIDTTTGPITVELDRAKAPITVANFLKYVDSGYYNNLVFHRVIPDFMVQGGGLTDTLKAKDDGLLDPIKNEAGNGLSNVRGTLAMARTGDPNSATSQFFINLTDNGVNGAQLDRNPRSAGYAVFGKVIDGMDTVDKIARVPTGQKRDARGMPYSDVPLKPIFIKSIKRKGKP